MSWSIRSVTEEVKEELIQRLRGRPETSDIIEITTNQSCLEEILVSSQAIREYLLLLWEKYQGAPRKLKTAILDELARNLGIHRRSAIRLMKSLHPPRSKHGFKGGRTKKYSEESKRHLATLWKLMGYMCPVRMKAAIPEWIEFYTHKDFNDFIKAEILVMSESSIKRFLSGERKKLARKVNTGTKGGQQKYIALVPVRNFEKRPEIPGHCEIDCVAHCGGSMSGEFIWTLTFTDIATGWTECEAVWGKTGVGIKKALAAIEKRLPFKILALYSDNGSEFMNRDIIEAFCKENRPEPLQFFRGRPYKKNDQAYVEQKNYTHVRVLFGHGRLDKRETVKIMNNIYRKPWRELQNYFMPQQRLLKKFRVGSKVIRKMSKPATPISRLEDKVGLKTREYLGKHKAALNPIRLKELLTNQTRKFFRIYDDTIHKLERGKLSI